MNTTRSPLDSTVRVGFCPPAPPPNARPFVRASNALSFVMNSSRLLTIRRTLWSLKSAVRYFAAWSMWPPRITSRVKSSQTRASELSDSWATTPETASTVAAIPPQITSRIRLIGFDIDFHLRFSDAEPSLRLEQKSAHAAASLYRELRIRNQVPMHKLTPAAAMLLTRATWRQPCGTTCPAIACWHASTSTTPRPTAASPHCNWRRLAGSVLGVAVIQQVCPCPKLGA